MGRFEHFDKFLIFWFEKFLQFVKRPFVQGQDLGHKCLEIIAISDPVPSRPENLLPLILIFIFGWAYSDTNDVHKDCFLSVLPNPPVCTLLGVNRNVRQNKQLSNFSPLFELAQNLG